MLNKFSSALGIALLSGSIALAAQTPSQPANGNGAPAKSNQTATSNPSATKKHHHKYHHKSAAPKTSPAPTPAPAK